MEKEMLVDVVKVDGGKRALMLETRAIEKDRSDMDSITPMRMYVYIYVYMLVRQCKRGRE